MEIYHTPVLTKEIIENLYISPNSTNIIDCTLGEGGISKSILDNLNNINIIGIDTDKSILDIAKKRLAKYKTIIYIPDNYKVVNKDPYAGAEVIQGYNAYKMNMKRKYRDVLSSEDFIIAPSAPDKTIEPAPILVHFENMEQRLHTDKTFELSSSDNIIVLKGPKRAEATYPQQWGM
jgi:hypothetical protein